MPGPQAAKHPSERRRRNTTGIVPDHLLPRAGREGDAPSAPIALGTTAAQWWEWVWHTPQAVRFTDGDMYALAVMACTIEDYVASREAPPHCGDCGGPARGVEPAKLAALIQTQCDKFGLSPKAMATLHWFMAAEDPVDVTPSVQGVTDIRARLKGTGSD